MFLVVKAPGTLNKRGRNMPYTIELDENEGLFFDYYIGAIESTEMYNPDDPSSDPNKPEHEDTFLHEDFIRDSMVDSVAFFSIIRRDIHQSQIHSAAHDFWISRNDAGSGFNDGSWPKHLAKKFTEIAKVFGGANVIFEPVVIEIEPPSPGVEQFFESLEQQAIKGKEGKEH